MKGAKNMSEIQNAIEVKNLKKGFGGRVLFENFSLNVKANTIHAIIGPNGSGKTTLLRLITGVYQPNAGTINIAGKYAMELENDYLYEEQTGLENLRIFGKYFGFEINDRSDSYCTQLGLTEHLGKRVSTYSKGMKAFDNTKLIGHYYEREKGAPLIVFFHGLWGHSYLDGVPIYRITQKHNWNLLLCDLRAQGDSEGEFSTLGVLEKYDCLDWVEWAQNRFGDKNPIFLMGVSMGASIVMMSSDLELPDSVYGIIDDCGFTSTLDVIKQNNNKQISKYIPKNLFPTMLNVGTKIWGSFDLSDADACKALAHTDIPLLIIHGDEDMQAPLSMAYKLYDSCNGEKQLYIVHGADHSENYRKDPGGYEKIVTKFIEERIERKDAGIIEVSIRNAQVTLSQLRH